MNNCSHYCFYPPPSPKPKPQETKEQLLQKNTACTPSQYSVTLSVVFLISDERSIFLSNTGIRDIVLYYLNFSEDVARTSYSHRELK